MSKIKCARSRVLENETEVMRWELGCEVARGGRSCQSDRKI